MVVVITLIVVIFVKLVIVSALLVMTAGACCHSAQGGFAETAYLRWLGKAKPPPPPYPIEICLPQAMFLSETF